MAVSQEQKPCRHREESQEERRRRRRGGGGEEEERRRGGGDGGMREGGVKGGVKESHIVPLVEVHGAGDGGESLVSVRSLRVHRRGNAMKQEVSR